MAYRKVVVLFLSIVAATYAAPAKATNFLVTSTGDSGMGTLRQAIFDANGNGGADTISFVFAGTSPVTIGILSALPVVTDTLTIDGTSMPGFSTAQRPLIVLQNMVTGGTQGGYAAIDLEAPNCVVKGLVIRNFYQAIVLGRPGGHTIQTNWIGLTADGSTAAANNNGIITMAGSNNNLIGGTSAIQRNVIAATLQPGIVINGACEIGHCGELSSNNTIQGNFIGTDATGMTAIPNYGGVWLTSQSSNTLVGGPPPSGGVTRNLLSGNDNEGISVDGTATVTYNVIGRNAAGGPLGNNGEGIRISDGTGSTISNNIISNNSGHGVMVLGHHTGIYTNSISANGLLGISLGGGLSPIPNDVGDGDTGPNDRQNNPVIMSALAEPSQLFVTGRLNSIPSSNYYVSFFSNTACDPSGSGEGETFLSAISLNTDATGIGNFSITIPVAVPAGRFITATARDAALNTSEFSVCRQVIALGAPHITSITPTSGAWGTTNVTINGDHFTSVNSVAFSSGSTNAMFTILSDTQILTTVPTGAATGTIRVVNPYGTAFSDPFTVSNPTPFITSVMPDNGNGGGGTSVTIKGSRFLTGAVVKFGGTSANNVVVSDQFTITCTTPPHIAETVDVQVINPDGGTDTRTFAFTYFCPGLNVNITAPDRLFAGATGAVASVPDAGPGSTYAWSVSNGTVTGGAGTRSITFSVANQDVTVSVIVNRPDCSAGQDKLVLVSVAHDDFNGDGKGDIPMQNTANGDVAVWQMNSMNMFGGVLVGNSGQYRLKTTGDFDGDGKNDFAFQDPATGDIVMWLMNGTAISSAPHVSNPPSNWQIVGSGDMNGDRKADLVLQNINNGDIAVWLMNGGSILSGNIVGTPGIAYRVAGVGRFNGDDKADIVLQNTSGEIVLWHMSSLTILDGGSLGNPGTPWVVKGVAAVRGGDNNLVLLRNSNTGDIAAWQVDGFLVSGFAVGNAGISNDLMGGADFDGDFTSDLLLRTSSGTLTVWLITQATVANGLAIGSTGPDYVPVMK